MNGDVGMIRSTCRALLRVDLIPVFHKHVLNFYNIIIMTQLADTNHQVLARKVNNTDPINHINFDPI